MLNMHSARVHGATLAETGLRRNLFDASNTRGSGLALLYACTSHHTCGCGAIYLTLTGKCEILQHLFLCVRLFECAACVFARQVHGFSVKAEGLGYRF